MDSMRSLNTSLPRSASPKAVKKPVPPDNIIQAFKAAALSVTNLYKEAASDQAANHENGYQEALEDLLAFMDKDGLGLADSEGKKIRQWVNERYQGTSNAQIASESDDEADDEKRGRSSSPLVERKQTYEDVAEETQAGAQDPRASHQATPLSHTPATESRLASVSAPSTTDFTFRSSHPYPTPNDTDMDTSTITIPASASLSTPPMRFEVHPRSTRSSQRHQNRNNRNNVNATNLGPGAGMKRRLNFDELFDINSINNNRKRRR